MGRTVWWALFLRVVLFETLLESCAPKFIFAISFVISALSLEVHGMTEFSAPGEDCCDFVSERLILPLQGRFHPISSFHSFTPLGPGLCHAQ